VLADEAMLSIMDAKEGSNRVFGFPPPPTPRTKWTRRVPHPVLIGHHSSFQVARARRGARARARTRARAA
jgi:hypothetical protein